MPTVPVLTENRQTLGALTPARLEAPDIGTGGRAIAAAGRRAGGALADAAETENEIDTIYAEGRAKQLDNEYQQFERDLLFGEDGYYLKQNADALNARGGVEQAIRTHQGELLSRTQDPLERQMLQTVFERRANEAFDGLARYAQGQARAYATEQSSARIGNAQENYVRFVDSDPERAAAERATILSEVASLADLNGWNDAEIIRSKREEALSGMHGAVINAQMLGDPTKAAAYLEQHRDEIDPVTAQRLDAQLQPLLVDHDARGFADLAEHFEAPLTAPVTEQTPGEVPGTPREVPNADAVWGRMIHTESRGRQLDSRGRTVTSPAGAIGIAQVMPETAREMARELGLPWDENRYRTDAAYNERLGRGYFAKMLRTFNGDVRKAVAAYNAGPGNGRDGRGVRGAMARGGANWEAHLPRETRNYLQSVLGEGGGGVAAVAGGQSQEVQAATRLAGQLEWVEQFIPERLAGKPPRYIEMVIDRTKAEIRQRHEETMIGVLAQEAAQREGAYEQVFALGTGFTSITQIPGHQALPVDLRMQLDQWATANRRAQLETSKPQTDHGFYTELSDLFARDPRGFLAVSPAEARRRLDDEDYERYVGWRRDAMKPGGNRAERMTMNEILTASSTLLAAAGLSTSNLRGHAAQVANEKRGQFARRMIQWSEGVHRSTGQWPDQDAIRRNADRLLIEGSWQTEGGMLGGGHHTGFAFEAPTDGVRQGFHAEVPADIRARIVRAMPNATERQIRQAYIDGRGIDW